MKVRFVILTLFMSVSFVSLATETRANEDTIRLSLNGAKEYAILHNINITNAELGVIQAQHQLRETIARGLPQVDATLDYSNFFGSSAALELMPGMEIKFTPTSNASLTVSQLIYSRSYSVGVQIASLYKKVMEASQHKTELEIKSQVAQAYLLLLVAEESSQILAANLKNLEKIALQTKTMVEFGVAEQVDYDQLRVQIAMLADAVRSAERQSELAMNMLRLQLGVSASTPLALTDNIETIVKNVDFFHSLNTPLTHSENPDFRQLELQSQMADKQVKLEKGAYHPTVAGFYNYTEKILKPEFDLTPKHVIGVNVSVPIFSSGARRAKVAQARNNSQVVHNQIDLLSQQLSIQEKQLKFNLATALDQYRSQSENLEVAGRVYESINNKYNQGVVSSMNLVTANNNLLQAQNSYISALLQLAQAQVELEKLLNLL